MITSSSSKKFDGLDQFNSGLGKTYGLLPFRFIHLDERRYLMTNEVGQYVILDRDTIVKFVKKEISPTSNIYNKLKANHFLIDSDSNVAIDLLALKYRTKYAPISNFTSLHMFVVTLRCEHSCPYCQVSRQSEDRVAFDMDTATADKALEFTFKSPSPQIKIEFQGGEPLLNFELIKYIVEKAEERNLLECRNLQFVIATNLALINDDILSFCLAHNVYISTSLDGPEDLHNLNRPKPGRNSYVLTIEGIKKVRSVLGPDKIAALMTTTKRSLPSVRDIIDEYIKQGFNSIFLRPLNPFGFAITTKAFYSYNEDEWINFYKTGLDYILNLNKQGLFFVEQYSALILNKMLTPFGTSFVDLQSPSGIGISCIVFNYDGDVYASDESRMLAEMGDKTFRLGSLHNDSYEDIMLADSLLDPLEQSIAESVPMCQDCGFQTFCGSAPVYHYATQGDFVGHKVFSGFCKKNMSIFRYLITKMEDDDKAKEILMRWIRI